MKIFSLLVSVPFCSRKLIGGEFWENSIPDLSGYLSRMPRQFSLFDCDLVYTFSRVSHSVEADLTHIFDGTLTASDPIQSVTLVQNHDTQPGQQLEAPIDDWFNSLAYALILLRAEGYPCVFYGHLYGISGGPKGFIPPTCGGQLGDFILARKLYAYGEQDNYFDFRTCIGWVRRGTWDRKYGCAVVLSNAGAGWKTMYVGTEHKGEVWTDLVCDPTCLLAYISLGGIRQRLQLGRTAKENFTAMRSRSVSIPKTTQRGEISLENRISFVETC